MSLADRLKTKLTRPVEEPEDPVAPPSEFGWSEPGPEELTGSAMRSSAQAGLAELAAADLKRQEARLAADPAAAARVEAYFRDAAVMRNRGNG